MGRTDNLYRLIYVSDLALSAPCDVGHILEAARSNNAELNVTGALWFDGKQFLQLLEGSKEALNRVFNTILRSTSHENVDVICFQPASRRLYGDWSMSYFGSEGHNRRVAEQFSGGPDICLRSMPTNSLVDMLCFLEGERQSNMDRQLV